MHILVCAALLFSGPRVSRSADQAFQAPGLAANFQIQGEDIEHGTELIPALAAYIPPDLRGGEDEAGSLHARHPSLPSHEGGPATGERPDGSSDILWQPVRQGSIRETVPALSGAGGIAVPLSPGTPWGLSAYSSGAGLSSAEDAPSPWLINGRPAGVDPPADAGQWYGAGRQSLASLNRHQQPQEWGRPQDGQSSYAAHRLLAESSVKETALPPVPGNWSITRRHFEDAAASQALRRRSTGGPVNGSAQAPVPGIGGTPSAALHVPPPQKSGIQATSETGGEDGGGTASGSSVPPPRGYGASEGEGAPPENGGRPRGGEDGEGPPGPTAPPRTPPERNPPDSPEGPEKEEDEDGRPPPTSRSPPPQGGGSGATTSNASSDNEDLEDFLGFNVTGLGPSKAPGQSSKNSPRRPPPPAYATPTGGRRQYGCLIGIRIRWGSG
eukprot:jgi/Botrbrau1/15234/Bobra.0149s0087.1